MVKLQMYAIYNVHRMKTKNQELIKINVRSLPKKKQGT